MKENLEPQETLLEIRQMMERSSRFISLNGLSGVFAGILALTGAFFAYQYLQLRGLYYGTGSIVSSSIDATDLLFFISDAALVLLGSLCIAIVLSLKKAQKHGVPFWDRTAKRVLINLMIPLVSGGLFCILLLYHGLVVLIAPSMLIFYGLALINASKYTYDDIRYLGISELVIGLCSTLFLGYGLFFWAAGFGLAHIVYGALMYFKYEK